MNVPLAPLPDLRDDRPPEVDHFGRRVLVIRAEGPTDAFAPTRTPAAGPLLENDRVRRERHRATFDARGGGREDRPAPSPLIRRPARAEGE